MTAVEIGEANKTAEVSGGGGSGPVVDGGNFAGIDCHSTGSDDVPQELN